MRKPSETKYPFAKGMARVLGLSLVLGLGARSAAAQDTVSAPEAHPLPQLTRPHPKSTLDDRVQLLSKALNLDVDQQSQLRMALVAQREQIMRVWNDPAVPPAYRISATRNISEQTADRIRSFLTEDQRKKFNPPRQAHEQDPNATVRSVEEWMKPPEAK